MKNNQHSARQAENTCLSAIFLVILTTFIATPVFSDQTSTTQTGLSKEQKLIVANLAGIAAAAAWGFRYWDYGSSKPYIEDDSWFQADSKHGGMDKIGHIYSSYSLSNILSYSYMRWGYTSDKAILYGALSGLGIMTFSEFGDSISSHGFSIQDWQMNVAGAAFAYVLFRFPEAKDLIDFRAQYIPTAESTDRFTDYERLKFLLALKLSGLKVFDHTIARYLELQLGYYARGYEFEKPQRSRNVYAAIGINLSELLRTKTGFRKTAIALNYLQVPFSYIDVKHDLNR